MDKEEFIELTGEDPEDMFGGDWKNEVDQILECKHFRNPGGYCIYCGDGRDHSWKEVIWLLYYLFYL